MKPIVKREKKYQASKTFTGRVASRKSFWNNYDYYKRNLEIDDADIKVLAFHGFGGNGKSSLLRALQKEMNDRLAKPKFIHCDLDKLTDMRSILRAMAKMLYNNYKFQFPLFDLGCYVYDCKVTGDGEQPEYQGYIDQNQLLACFIEAVGAIPFAGIPVQILKSVDKGVAWWRNLRKEHDGELKDIKDKNPQELYDYLPVLFAQDMNDNLKDTKDPFVVFLDTYEQLVNEITDKGNQLDNDRWLRGNNGLIAWTGGKVFWVIAGRECLKWVKLNHEWENSLEQHELSGLPFGDSDAFLKSAGIKEDSLRRELYNLTEGIPVFLDVCVDEYIALKNKGENPSIEKFGENKEALIGRFVLYMDRNYQDMVYMFSCLRQWDDYMIEEIGPKAVPSFSITSYEKFKDFSIISKSEESVYSMNRVVSDLIFKSSCSAFIRNKVAELAAEYCKKQLENHSVFDWIYHYYLNWLMKFCLRIYEDTDAQLSFFEKYIDEKLFDLIKSGQLSIAKTIVLPFLQAARNNQDNRVFRAKALDIDSNLCYYGGNYAETNNLRQQVIDIRTECLGDMHPDTIVAKNNLALSFRKMGLYYDALELQEKVFSIRKEMLGLKSVETIAAMHNLALTLDFLGRYEDAAKMQKDVLNLRLEILDENHPDIISGENNLAISLRKLGKYEEALELQNKVLSYRIAHFGENHPKTFNAMNNKAIILRKLERYEDALELNEDVLEGQRKLFGEMHPKTISAMNNLARTLYCLSRYEEALEIQKKVLSVRSCILGDKHPKTISSRQNLSMTLYALDRYNEALEQQKQVVDLQTKSLGDKHPDTVKSEEYLQALLVKLGYIANDKVYG